MMFPKTQLLAECMRVARRRYLPSVTQRKGPIMSDLNAKARTVPERTMGFWRSPARQARPALRVRQWVRRDYWQSEDTLGGCLPGEPNASVTAH